MDNDETSILIERKVSQASRDNILNSRSNHALVQFRDLRSSVVI